MSPLFDDYVVVDWSGNSTPKSGKDSIWIGRARRDDGGLDVELTNPRTRSAAAADVRRLLHAGVREGRRTLIGFDFPYAYPAGFAAALGLDGWRDLWRELARLVEDDPDNGNNRWQVAAELNRRTGAADGPFWNGPAAAIGVGLRSRRGVFPMAAGVTTLNEYRAVELHLRSTGRLAHSCWKLYTAGSVGSQALLGIPVLERLHSDPELAPHSAIWPFETGFRAPSGTGPAIVHAEIWPSLIPIDLATDPVKDAAQVRGLATWFAHLDDAGELGALFIAPDWNEGASVEEGWVLGA